MKSEKKARFEVISHGVDYPDYFPGQGTAFEAFERVSTGAGDNEAEAYAEAVEGIYQVLPEAEAEALRLPKRPRGINAKNKVPSAMGKAGAFFYVSILY